MYGNLFELRNRCLTQALTLGGRPVKRDNLRILVIGGGGREHALVWKLKASPRVSRVYAAPGNPGMHGLAECVSISVNDVHQLACFALQNHVDLAVVGPEAPLALGVSDEFARLGMPVFGPTRAAASIETSKVWAKQFMSRHRIPTADYSIFRDVDAAKRYVRAHGSPVVVKADGLAAGKGVVVAHTPDEAEQAVDTISHFAEDAEIIVEDCLIGREASFLVITDGISVLPLISAKDHKRAKDGDKGPNTGGMGAIVPAPGFDASLEAEILEEIIMPAIRGLSAEGRRYVGVLYAGLMLTSQGPMALEFNARFGDPETQAILPMMESDLVDLLEAAVEGTCSSMTINWRDGACVCAVAASLGYPENPQLGKEIFIDADRAQKDGALVFHAGTRLDGETLVTSGGRVLNVVSTGGSVKEAASRAYRGLSHVSFEGMWFRNDIGS